MGSFIFFEFLFVFGFMQFGFTFAQVEERNLKNKAQLLKSTSAQETWTVYDRSNFEESELCRVLNCRKQDFCLVKGEDAICLHRKRLRDAPGRKVFYRRSSHVGSEPDDPDIGRRRHPVRQQSVTKQRHRSQSRKSKIEPPPPVLENSNNNNHAEWDPDRVRQKLANYYRSMKRKERNRAALARPNNYEIPDTFKENALNGINSGQKSNNGGQMGKKQCNQEQLLDISARLLQWFSDMQTHHEPIPSTNWRRRNLHVACRREAIWMFSQLDHDGDDSLDSDELYALTYDQYEPCVKPFLDRCDRNVNNRLSLQEWCVCFP